MTESGACSVVEIFNLEIIFINFRSLASCGLSRMGSEGEVKGCTIENNGSHVAKGFGVKTNFLQKVGHAQ